MKRARWAMVAFASGALISCNTAAFEHTYMALDQHGDRKRSVFYTDTDQIYCVAEMAVGRKDVTVGATLRQTAAFTPPHGDSVPVDAVLALKEASPMETGSDVIVSFEITKANAGAPWSAGQFVCELSIDGSLEATLPFRIDYPACPLQAPLAGDTCQGFFLPESRCPGAIGGQACVCAESGKWQCS